MFNVNEKDRAWVDAQCTPHSLKCFFADADADTRADRSARGRGFVVYSFFRTCLCAGVIERGDGAKLGGE